MNDAGRAAHAGRRLRVTCIAFVISSLAAYAVAGLDSGARGVAYIALHLALGGLMLTAAWLSREADSDSLRWIVGAGVLTAVLLLPVPSFTTHDVQRYLWDGRVVLEGLDPYRMAPNDSAVAWLRATWPTPAEHAAYPTLYPPGALALFAGAALFGASLGIWVWKLLVTAAAVGVIVLCARLARSLGAERHLAWVALNPLLLLEAGVGAHLDVVAALALAAAVLQWQRQRLMAVGALLGLGALIKLTPVLALVPLLLALRRWADAVRLVGGAAAVLIAGYGLALAIGLLPWGSTGAFFAGWSFGSPLGSALAMVAGEQAVLVGAVVGAIGLLVTGLWARRGEPLRAVAWALALPLLLSPVSFPWYLVVLVPLLVVSPSALFVAWMLAAPLTYEVLDAFDRDGTWAPAAWPLLFIVMAWCMGAVVARRSLRRRQLG